MGKAMIEGPIQKFKEGSGSTSFVLTGKKSIIDNTSKTLYQYAAQDEDVFIVIIQCWCEGTSKAYVN